MSGHCVITFFRFTRLRARSFLDAEGICRLCRRQATEDVESAEAILSLAHAHGVEMPITEVICALLHEKITLDEAAAVLMQRPPKPER